MTLEEAKNHVVLKRDEKPQGCFVGCKRYILPDIVFQAKLNAAPQETVTGHLIFTQIYGETDLSFDGLLSLDEVVLWNINENTLEEIENNREKEEPELE